MELNGQFWSAILQSVRSACDEERYSRELIDALAVCSDRSVLRRALEGISDEPLLGVADEDLIYAYLGTPRAASISVNPFFDEQWYRLNHPDVYEAIRGGQIYSGFAHYLLYGIREGRWPNAILQSLAVSREDAAPRTDRLDESTYLEMHAGAREFLRHFPILTPLQHYNLFGRFLRLPLPERDSQHTPSSDIDLLATEFDADYYRERYLKNDVSPLAGDPFSHYLVDGISNAYSPNADFDEAWYRCFYCEVRDAIARGEVLNGFHHFLASGRREGRLQHFERKLALEARIPGVTRPILMHRIGDIHARVPDRPITINADAAARVWFLVPTMNPDIAFGGYRSLLELISATQAAGYRVGIICTNDLNSDREYFLWREKSPKIKDLIATIPVISDDRSVGIEFGANDTLVAYSAWELYFADRIRALSKQIRVVFLAQEYEPIFHDNSSVRAMVEDAYRIPHFPLINTYMLSDYLKKHGIGVFAKRGVKESRDYAVFEHRINVLASQTETSIKRRKERFLIAYARPESHAARNMFEILILALRRVCGEGLFGPEWTFIGLGALTEIEDVPIGGGHVLQMKPKMSEEEYVGYISAMDIGMSLMFAPHPSVMPYEFATTAALVVTNSYENRTPARLAAISGNIIAGRPSIDGIAEALRTAVSRVPDAKTRVKQALRPANTDWSTIFNAALLRTLFGEPPVPFDTAVQNAAVLASQPL